MPTSISVPVLRGLSAKARRAAATLVLSATALLAPSAFAAADLGITVNTGNPTPTAGGAAFAYTLVVTNAGPSDATGVTVLDALPPGMIFQSVAVVNAPSTPGFGLICSGPPIATNGTVSCRGTMPGAALSTATITIVAQVVPDVAVGVRTNSATVTSNTQEVSPNTTPNTDSIQQNIQVNAPLSISLSGPATVARGANVVYELIVNNGGSSTALNATITDTLPANTTFVSLFGTSVFHDGCSATPAGVVSCNSIDIPTGQHKLTIVAKTAANTPLGQLDNSALINTAGTGTIAVGSAMTSATVTP